MKKMSSVIFDAAEQFEKMAVYLFSRAQDMAASAQAADVKAVVAPALGLKSKGGGDFEFDVNSKAADVIFNSMEAAGFTGEVHIKLVADSKKKATLVVTTKPSNQPGNKVAATVKVKLEPGVTAALSKLKLAITDSIQIEDIVTAANQ